MRRGGHGEGRARIEAAPVVERSTRAPRTRQRRDFDDQRHSFHCVASCQGACEHQESGRALRTRRYGGKDARIRHDIEFHRRLNAYRRASGMPPLSPENLRGRFWAI